MRKINFRNRTSMNKKIQTVNSESNSAQSLDSAVTKALAYVGVQKNEINSSTFISANDMYEIIFSTDWLHYDIFVNCITGEVSGCSFEPVTVNFAMGVF